MNGTAMPQADFSRFIEDNVKDIREPDGADVLEVARAVGGEEGRSSSPRRSACRTGSANSPTTRMSRGPPVRGQLKIPEEFKLGIPVFIDGPAYEVTARLRYPHRQWPGFPSGTTCSAPTRSSATPSAKSSRRSTKGISVDVLMGMPER